MMILTMSMSLRKSNLKLTEPNQNTINRTLKSLQNDVKDDPCVTINDDIEVEMRIEDENNVDENT